MTNKRIAGQRMRSQRIAGAKFEKPEDVVRGLGALQAQDFLQALWAVGLRTESATAADIEQAIADRKIVLTWPMRGTLHFAPPDHLRSSRTGKSIWSTQPGDIVSLWGCRYLLQSFNED